MAQPPSPPPSSGRREPPRVVVAGHACLDLIPDLPGPVSLEPGTLTRIGAAEIALGGCVPNVGLALQRLGLCQPRLVAHVGDDPLADLMLDRLAGLGPQANRHVTRQAGGATSYSIVVAPKRSDRLFWHCPGANESFSPGDVTDRMLEGAAWLHVGYPPLLPRFTADGGAACAELFGRARAAGLTTSLDLCSIDPASEAGRVDWQGWLQAVLPHVDVFAPSYDEAAAALACDLDLNCSSITALAERLLALGPGRVVVKLGAYGLMTMGRQGQVHDQPRFVVDNRGATGAGDAAIAGLITARLDRAPWPDALRIACGVAASACEQPDATSGIAPLAEIRRRLARGWPTGPTLPWPIV